MVRRGILYTLCFGLLLTLGTGALADTPEGQPIEDPLVVYFYSQGCPDCATIKELLDVMVYDLPRGADDIAAYDVAEEGVLDLLVKLESAFGVEAPDIPMVFIGTADVFTVDSPEPRIMDAITRCARENCPSPLSLIAPKPFPWGDVLRLSALALIGLLLAVWQTH